MFFSRGRNQILVIDDDASLRRQLRFRLEKFDKAEVIEAENGKAGLAKAYKYDPDLIILDWMMPDIEGDEVLRNLRQGETTKRIPVIMLTGKTKIGDIEDAFDLGADLYLTKPFTLQQISEKIQELLGKK